MQYVGGVTSGSGSTTASTYPQCLSHTLDQVIHIPADNGSCILGLSVSEPSQMVHKKKTETSTRKDTFHAQILLTLISVHTSLAHVKV